MELSREQGLKLNRAYIVSIFAVSMELSREHWTNKRRIKIKTKKQKIAYSGSHGTGKTTDVYQSCCDMKKHGMNVGIVSEIARESPLPINREAPVESQLWIVTKQIEAEIRIGTIYPTIVCDRTIVDCCTYCFFIDRELFKVAYKICELHINTYNEIYFKLIKNNNYLIEDGVRDMDTQYQQDVEDKMLEIYKKLKCDWITYI